MNISLTLTLIFGLLSFSSCDKKSPENTITETNNSLMDTAYFSTIEFPSTDDLVITADVYHLHKDSSVIVLCHQAGWSRGEYKEIGPKLNDLGFNCIAIDQRSGGVINGVQNETAKRAVSASKPQTYNDAKQDIVSAVDYAAKSYNQSVYLWGSSYSSSLVLIIAKEHDKVHTVLSFSPGEYLNPVNVKNSISGLDKPAFLTSSKSEQAQTKLLYDAITSTRKTQFVPNGNGEHGSRALWSDKADQAEYWAALKTFLGK